jgi:excisionase family DNA binding protein
MSEASNSKVYTSGDVAKICGVSPDTVSRWFDVGHIEGYRLGPGGDRRIPHDKLREFMIKHGIPLERLDETRQCILVVDDEPEYLKIIPAALAPLDGFDIITASTGFDAGALVVERNPRVVILDISLTDMDGRMVCARVKSRPETQHTRVLAISGVISDAEFAELRNDGFDDYLKKPFHVDEVVNRVRELLRLPDTKVAQPVVSRKTPV